MAAAGVRRGLADVLARRDIRILAAATVIELALVGLYFGLTAASLSTPRYAVYPFVWINGGVLAVWHTRLPRAPRRRQWLAAGLAAAYLLLLLYLAGLVDVTLAGNPQSMVGVEVFAGSPGWSRARLIAPNFSIILLPYRVIGYACLAFLVYATVLDTAGAALTGAVGLLSCVSCSFPIVAGLVAGIAGGSAGVTAAALGYTVDISTLVFLVSVALLYWRPGFPGTARQTGSGTAS